MTSALGALPESVECAASAQRFSMSLALEDIHNMARLRERLTGNRVTVDEAHGRPWLAGWPMTLLCFAKSCALDVKSPVTQLG